MTHTPEQIERLAAEYETIAIDTPSAEATVIALALRSLAEGMRREAAEHVAVVGNGVTHYVGDEPPPGTKLYRPPPPVPGYAEGLEAAATVVMALRSTVEDPSWNDALDEAVDAIRANKEAG